MCTPFSAFPLDCAYSGLQVICLKSYFLVNCCHSLLLKHGPLSLITMVGMPCLAKMDLTCVMTQADDVFDSNAISGKLG